MYTLRAYNNILDSRATRHTIPPLTPKFFLSVYPDFVQDYAKHKHIKHKCILFVQLKVHSRHLRFILITVVASIYMCMFHIGSGHSGKKHLN